MKGGEINIAFLKIGKITHYYDKIGVGVVNLTTGSLSVGETIKIQQGDDEFLQKIESIQVEHQQVNSIKKGEDAGIKLDQAVKAGAEVYKDSG